METRRGEKSDIVVSCQKLVMQEKLTELTNEQSLILAVLPQPVGRYLAIALA